MKRYWIILGLAIVCLVLAGQAASWRQQLEDCRVQSASVNRTASITVISKHTLSIIPCEEERSNNSDNKSQSAKALED